MFDIPKNQLSRRPFRVHNPSDRPLTVSLEPWAECYDLGPNGTFDVVFIGPRNGMPEVVPYPDSSLTVYGWEGSDVFVLQEGRLVSKQVAIDESVRQELDLAKDSIVRTKHPMPAEQLVWAQKSLDDNPAIDHASQDTARELAAVLVIELAPCLVRSESSTNLLWRIADRIVGTRGLVLGSPEFAKKDRAVWGEHPYSLEQLIREQSVSVLPSAARRSGRGPQNTSRQQRAESESDPRSS
jgi:hypothetical protein